MIDIPEWHQPIPPQPVETMSLSFVETFWNWIKGKKPESLNQPIANFDSQLSAIVIKENSMSDTTLITTVNLPKEVIAKASFYLNDVSVNDAAPWLDQLMADGGNPAHWTPGLPYCISAASACWGFVMKKYGIAWPFQAVPGTQLFYDNANAAGLAVKVPNPGDIVIYKDGNSAQGHAEIVVSIDEVNLHTIGFNTSSNAAGNMRAGNGCFMKSRSLTAFHGPRNVGMWIRGYVGMSQLTAPAAQPTPYSA